MQLHEPKKYDECECCLDPAPLLMPVGFAPGHPAIVWQRMCLRCRLAMTSDKYTLMESDMRHSKFPETRAAHSEWMAATI